MDCLILFYCILVENKRDIAGGGLFWKTIKKMLYNTAYSFLRNSLNSYVRFPKSIHHYFNRMFACRDVIAAEFGAYSGKLGS